MLAAATLIALGAAAALMPSVMRKGLWNSVPRPVLPLALQFADTSATDLFEEAVHRSERMTAWERRLVAKFCGRILAAPDTDLLPRTPGATMAPGHGQALAVLRELGSNAATSVPQLTVLLANSGADSRVLDVLTAIGPAADSAAPSVIAAVGHPGYLDYARAFRTLVAIGAPTDASLPIALRVTAKAARMSDRAAAAGFALREFPQTQVFDMIRGMLASPDTDERVIAARAIQQSGPQASPLIPAILTAIRDRDHPIDASAVWALAAIKAPAVPALCQLLNEPNTEAARAAAAALGIIGPDAESAVPALIRILTSADSYLPPHAANSLGLIGRRASNALPALEALAQSESPGAPEAARAIERIRG